MAFQNQQSQSGEDEIEFIDAENYTPQPKGAISYEQIVLEQVRRCIVEGSKEMTGGYYRERVTKAGVTEVYVPDQKQVYMRAIDSLNDLLLSFFDDQMKQDSDEFDRLIDEIKKDKIESLKKKQDLVEDVRIKQKLQFQIETGYLDVDSVEAKQEMDERLEVYRWLLQRLLLLFGRQRYLIAQAIED